LIDGVGFPFENYDGIGAFRTTDAGKPVDASGEVIGSDDADGRVIDAPALIRRLADSNQVRDCVATRWYELGQGRSVDQSSRCRISELQRLFRAGKGDLRDLVSTIALDAARRARPATEVSSGIASPLIVKPSDRLSAQKIVLDLLSTQVLQLRQRLTLPEDRMRLDQHLDGLRELEKKLQ
jgi:hypothetical protein